MQRTLLPHHASSGSRAASRRARQPLRGALLGGLLVLLGALLIGGATPFAQQYLPDWLRSLSNSIGGWTAPVFLLVWLSRARPVWAAVLGVVAFLALVEGYGIVSTWRGHYFATGFSSIWSLIGLVTGPVIGVAASFARQGRPLWRVLGMAVPAAVLLGEGVWALRHVADTNSPVYWTLEIVAAVALMAVALLRTRLRWPAATAAVVIWLAGAATFVAALDAAFTF